MPTPTTDVPTIPRQQFRDAIDAALMANLDRVPSDAWVRLRKVGVTAESFRTGNYDRCPLGLAGFSFREGRAPWMESFAFAFDDAIRLDCQTSGGCFYHGDFVLDPPPASSSDRSDLRWSW